MNKNLIVGDVILDQSNQIFFEAAQLVLETNNQLIYLSGKAGTGKTTFLKYIKQQFKGACVVLAPTGVSAINAGGQTIHSFFKLESTIYLPDDIRLSPPEIYDRLKYHAEHIKLLKSLSLIIIDEVSMVRCDILDAIDSILKIYRKTNKPFGGVKVLLTGDVFQLPPVLDDFTKEVIKRNYDSPYFFSSLVYANSNALYLELEKPYRQNETEFLNILDKVRIDKISDKELKRLNEREPLVSSIFVDEEPIFLTPTNTMADSYNSRRFQELSTPIFNLKGSTTGDFSQRMMLTNMDLNLRVGAQVMILRNKRDTDGTGYEYYNGEIGIIESVDLMMNAIHVRLPKRCVIITQEQWENIEFIWNTKENTCEKRVKGTFTQYPLRLAWAITIHKSQGLTFDRVIADLSKCFDYGQVYVALSRCRRLSGLMLKSQISRNNIKTDSRILNFVKNKTPHTLIVKELEMGMADKLYKEARVAFNHNKFDSFIEALYKAIKIRDDRDTFAFNRYLKAKFMKYHQFGITINKVEENFKNVCLDLENEKSKYLSLSQDYQLKEAKKEKIRLIELSNFHIYIEVQQEEIQMLKSRIDQTVKKNNDDLETKEYEIMKLSQTIEDQQNKITILNERIVETENDAYAEIKKLQHEIQQIHKKNNEAIKQRKVAKIEHLKRQVEFLLNKLSDADAKIEALKNRSWADKLFKRQ